MLFLGFFMADLQFKKLLPPSTHYIPFYPIPSRCLFERKETILLVHREAYGPVIHKLSKVPGLIPLWGVALGRESVSPKPCWCARWPLTLPGKDWPPDGGNILAKARKNLQFPSSLLFEQCKAFRILWFCRLDWFTLVPWSVEASTAARRLMILMLYTSRSTKTWNMRQSNSTLFSCIL